MQTLPRGVGSAALARFPQTLASIALAALLSIALVPAAALAGAQQAWAEGSGTVDTWYDQVTGITYKYKRLQYVMPANTWRVNIVGISGASEVNIPSYIDSDYIVRWVDIDGNTEVKSIDVNSSSLQSFTWTNGSLSSLTINGLRQLQTIECNNNNLDNLQLHNLESCYSIDCSRNQLTSLDFDNLPSLTSLNCSNNKLAIDISSASVADIASCSYNGNAITPDIIVKSGLITLSEGVDYTVSYENNVNAGTATVVVTGVGNCFGTTTKTFEITPDKIESVVLSSSSFTYDCTAKTPAVTVKSGLITLSEGVDYTVSYENNVNAGTATVIVTGVGNYSGTVVKTFKITKTNLGKASAKVAQESVSYSGRTLKPSVTVKLNGKTLRKGTDYTVSYKNNKSVGTATVTVTGKGAYEGTKTATFKIVPKGASVSKLAKAKKAFTVKWKKPSKANLKQTTGYQVRWSTAKSMKGAKTKTVKATSSAGKKCTLKVSKLKGGKKYYVQVRAYKKAAGKMYYSSWSKAKAVKTKK